MAYPSNSTLFSIKKELTRSYNLRGKPQIIVLVNLRQFCSPTQDIGNTWRYFWLSQWGAVGYAIDI